MAVSIFNTGWKTTPDLTITTNTSNLLEDLDKLLAVTTPVKKNKTYEIPDVKQVYFNKKSGHTAIVWSDDTSTVVHCGEGEKFEEYMGFCAAVMKKLFGSTSAAKKVMEDHNAEKMKVLKEEERQKKAEAKRKQEAENRERKLRREEGRLKKFSEMLDKILPTPTLDSILDDICNRCDRQEANDHD